MDKKILLVIMAIIAVISSGIVVFSLDAFETSNIDENSENESYLKGDINNG